LVYKIKTCSDGTVDRYKVRCLIQEYGVDYEETFVPVARLSSVCALLAVAASQYWSLSQMDVKNAFLNGDLSEKVYMQPSPRLSLQKKKRAFMNGFFFQDGFSETVCKKFIMDFFFPSQITTIRFF